MTDQELLQAIGQVVETVVETKLDPIRQDIHVLREEVQELQKNYAQIETKVNGIRMYMDTEQKRTLNLLLEGQQALWDRFVPQERFDPLEDRTEVLELTVKRHSQEIRQLQYA